MARTKMMSYIEDELDSFLNDIRNYAEQMKDEEDKEEREDLLGKLDNSINFMKEFMGI